LYNWIHDNLHGHKDTILGSATNDGFQGIWFSNTSHHRVWFQASAYVYCGQWCFEFGSFKLARNLSNRSRIWNLVISLSYWRAESSVN
jgi:hypothetical protein